jgi:UTP--glucose-1-phosphate uridylyltransferase
VDAAAAKMRSAGVPDAAIRTFQRQRERVRAGSSGLLQDSELEPVHDVPELASIAGAGAAARAPLDRTVVIKLNGGLATTMGLSQPKSLVEAKGGLTFLEMVVRQVLALRERHDVALPLVLMNSFSTSDATLAALESHPELQSEDVPLEFLQNREPKLRADDLEPVSWPDDPRLEWCPPGHGDLYTALASSGTLAALLERGYRHAFVSNADNLGAVLDPAILGWVAAERIPFLMEVVIGTEADRKGGHIAWRDGRLVLRETAQTPEEDAASFRDFRRWRHYNTNNLWIDLEALAARLERDGGALDLPVIVNRKTVDPRDPETPDVVQLETAMGSAIGLFDGARALCVPRSRFAPVKTTDDLLVLRSDAYVLTPDWRVEPAPGRGPAPPYVELDPAYYKLLAGFEERFPAGPPSLVGCDRLVVRGDVEFGAGVVAQGAVEVSAGRGRRGGRARIPDGAALSGRVAV